MNVHQIISAISFGDAVSNDAIALRKILRKNGFTSNLYAKYIDPRVSDLVEPIEKYQPDPSNIVIYHLAFGGAGVSEFVMDLPDIKIIKYHNITPPYFFYPYNKDIALGCETGLKELKELATHFQFGFGDSKYNCDDLNKSGFLKTVVLPILLDFERISNLDGNVNPVKDKNMVDIIFVGRISPNKKQDDIIHIFYFYHFFINKNSRLSFIGKCDDDLYFNHLKNILEKLGLEQSVVFTGLIKDEDLVGYYKTADIFLCMSEHEGFCVPLVESMYFGVPVIAFNSSCIPDTLGNSGILVNDKSRKMEIAELIDLVIKDDVLKEKIVKRQRERLKHFEEKKIEQVLIHSLEEISKTTGC
jgi:glycosyltransferase involved in cell wall biosynthesis